MSQKLASEIWLNFVGLELPLKPCKSAVTRSNPGALLLTGRTSTFQNLQTLANNTLNPLVISFCDGGPPSESPFLRSVDGPYACKFFLPIKPTTTCV